MPFSPCFDLQCYTVFGQFKMGAHVSCYFNRGPVLGILGSRSLVPSILFKWTMASRLRKFAIAGAGVGGTAVLATWFLNDDTYAKVCLKHWLAWSLFVWLLLCCIEFCYYTYGTLLGQKFTETIWPCHGCWSTQSQTNQVTSNQKPAAQVTARRGIWCFGSRRRGHWKWLRLRFCF